MRIQPTIQKGSTDKKTAAMVYDTEGKDDDLETEITVNVKANENSKNRTSSRRTSSNKKQHHTSKIIQQRIR